MADGRFQKYLREPPEGRAAERARDFGIDLSLTYRNMFELTMSELPEIEAMIEARRVERETGGESGRDSH